MSAKFHPLASSVALPKRFTFPFAYSPHQLCVKAATEVQAYVALQHGWKTELKLGKMFGVLVVEALNGQLGYLAAFSGQLQGTAEHDFFVPAVFDYLQPHGYFKKHEAEISDLNRQISALENSKERAKAAFNLNAVRATAKREVADYQAVVRDAKVSRDSLRRNSRLTPVQEAALVRESQFQKAELKRLKARWNERIAQAERQLQGLERPVAELKQLREQLSVQLQNWLFGQFVFLNAKGERADLLQIFESSTQPLPPSGAGECCAPKLLQYAFANGFKPLAMAEFWWGDSPKQEVRHHGEYYPACKGKCEPILRFMLQGLDVEPSPVLGRATKAMDLKVLFEDEWFLVVLKPSGMLSVPGKVKADCVTDFLLRQRPDLSGGQTMVVHRLDMDTSGLLVVAKSLVAFKKMQSLFESRQVQKRYTALLNGRIPYPTQPLICEFRDQPHPVGRVSLPLCPNVADRPRQMVSYEYGKDAITYYEILGYKDGFTRVSFFPQTGRTHQLRVHAAHASGLNTPIVGDDLYGASADRLCLHAAELVFTHPFTGKVVDVVSEADF